MYDDEGYVRYDLVAASSDFRRGLDRLIGGLDRFRVAIMCGEEDPLHCHRRLLVGRVLVEAAIEVQHIRADGRIEAENELMERERATGGEQLGLFNDNGARSWRSIRSVLPAREPKDSLRP
jgi:hypothetical protein